jgi:hypothetical protein
VISAPTKPPRQASPATPPREGNNLRQALPATPPREGNNPRQALPTTQPGNGNWISVLLKLFPSFGGVPEGRGGHHA